MSTSTKRPNTISQTTGTLRVNKAQTNGSNLTIVCSLYYPLATPKY